MARISLPSEDHVSGEIQEIYERVGSLFGFVPNLIKALAHCPAILKSFLPCMEAVVQGDMEPQIKEVAILRTCFLNHCRYLVFHHERMAEGLGISRKKIMALEKSPISKDIFSEPEKAAIQLADEMTGQVSASEAVLLNLKRFFKEPQIVELAFAVALFNHLSRFVDTFALELEF